MLELGGSDPFIVLEDADINAAVKGAVLGRTLNAGQVCIGSKRIIVHKKIADDFTKKFSEAMKNLIVGNPLDSKKTQVAVWQMKKAVKSMESFVDDAVAKGAVIAAGGKNENKRIFL